MDIGQLILNCYEIDDLLPSGGQANLARAIDQQTGDRVVIKQLNVGPDDKHHAQELARFQRAAQIRTGHPVVVDPIDSGEEQGWHYAIFPYVEGIQLDSFVQQHGGKLQPVQALDLLRHLAEGVGVIHAQAIVHRDLKPANILITTDGLPHIIDLGISKHLHEQTLTQDDGMIGTLWWMSPEQYTTPKDIDHRSDLYALGAVFYYMLTGRVPADGQDPGSVAVSVCQNMPPSPRQLDPAIPEQVDRICMTLLQKSPDARYQDAAELLHAITKGGVLDHGRSPNSTGSYCTSCGKPVNTSFQFCPGCGAPQHGSPKSERCLACGTPVNGDPNCPGCNRAFSPSNHRLTFQAGPLTGTCFRIPEGIYIVGRQELDPRESHISRRQFHVASLNGSIQIEDAGSTNGTTINSRPAQGPVALPPGCQLAIAGNTAVYTNH